METMILDASYVRLPMHAGMLQVRAWDLLAVFDIHLGALFPAAAAGVRSLTPVSDRDRALGALNRVVDVFRHPDWSPAWIAGRWTARSAYGGWLIGTQRALEGAAIVGYSFDLSQDFLHLKLVGQNMPLVREGEAAMVLSVVFDPVTA